MKKIISFLIPLICICTIGFSSPPSHWALKDVQSLRNTQLVEISFFSGYHVSITRQEFAYLAVLLYEDITNQPINTDNSYFLDTQNIYVLKVQSIGIIQGYDALTFRPHNSGIDLVLSGHDHIYSRTSMLKGILTPPPDGVVYVCGWSSSGSKYYAEDNETSFRYWRDIVYDRNTPVYSIIIQNQ